MFGHWFLQSLLTNNIHNYQHRLTHHNLHWYDILRQETMPCYDIFFLHLLYILSLMQSRWKQNHQTWLMHRVALSNF